jgi:hypothetical protein
LQEDVEDAKYATTADAIVPEAKPDSVVSKQQDEEATRDE